MKNKQEKNIIYGKKHFIIDVSVISVAILEPSKIGTV
jgi:hypothetical protein